MRILLVVYDNDSYVHWFPQGLAYIAAVLKKNGHEVGIYNQDLHHYPEEHLTEYLNRNRYDVVGFSFIAGYYQYKKALKISRAVNRAGKKPFYIIGGHGPSPEPEFFLKKTEADVVVMVENLLVADDDVNQRVFSSNYIQASVPQIAGLSYRLNAGIDYAQRNGGRYYGRNTQTGLAVGGLSRVSTQRRNDWTLENILRYTRSFGAHNLDVTGLYSNASNAFEADSARGQGYPNDVLTYRSNLPGLLVPVYNVTESRLVSQMGRVNYSFDERYLVTLTARRDGYSGFS